MNLFIEEEEPSIVHYKEPEIHYFLRVIVTALEMNWLPVLLFWPDIRLLLSFKDDFPLVSVSLAI